MAEHEFIEILSSDEEEEAETQVVTDDDSTMEDGEIKESDLDTEGEGGPDDADDTDADFSMEEQPYDEFVDDDEAANIDPTLLVASTQSKEDTSYRGDFTEQEITGHSLGQEPRFDVSQVDDAPPSSYAEVNQFAEHAATQYINNQEMDCGDSTTFAQSDNNNTRVAASSATARFNEQHVTTGNANSLEEDGSMETRHHEVAPKKLTNDAIRLPSPAKGSTFDEDTDGHFTRVSHNRTVAAEKDMPHTIDPTESATENAPVAAKETIEVADLMKVRIFPRLGIQTDHVVSPSNDLTRAHCKELDQLECRVEPKNKSRPWSFSQLDGNPTSKTALAVEPTVKTTVYNEVKQNLNIKAKFNRGKSSPEEFQVRQPQQVEAQVEIQAGRVILPTYSISLLVNDDKNQHILEPYEEVEIAMVHLTEVQQMRNLITSHVRVYCQSRFPKSSKFDVIVTLCPKSHHWVAHAVVLAPGKGEWEVLVEFRDAEGYVKALHGLLNLAIAMSSRKMTGRDKMRGNMKGFPFPNVSAW
ncbi:hypothetical protein K504DRAFT_57860 [Pleomassaria siparia CBS 279.74]|uniref:Uncharacterized protein n=1 Tax=Pleomassaria siparia CBS 279.74 TaxID=1314801 RepID=A0A6G1K224_9PLEO|nr:hypothetical protein K504DRAFT_57860 [Pleomassaria siparia CBS 279.74]